MPRKWRKWPTKTWNGWCTLTASWKTVWKSSRPSPMQSSFLSYRKNSAAFTTIRYPSSPTGTPLSIIFSHWVRFQYHLPNQMPWAKTWKNGDSSSSALPFAMPICKLRGLSTTIWRIAFAEIRNNKTKKYTEASKTATQSGHPPPSERRPLQCYKICFSVCNTLRRNVILFRYYGIREKGWT